MRALPLSLALVLAIAGSACEGSFGPGRRAAEDPYRHVLFVGNSHTYEFNVPGMVLALAHDAGDTLLRTWEIAEANFALEDHFNNGRVQSVLGDFSWSWVVLQQGTSALPESQEHLEHWTRQFEPYIRAAGATPVLYQIWLMWTRRFDADAALTSYWNAAVAVNGLLAPAGDAFTVALEMEPPLNVYSQDGFHASRLGAYLSALVIVSRLTGVHPESLPPSIPFGIDDTVTVRSLQRAATTALARNPAQPTARRYVYWE